VAGWVGFLEFARVFEGVLEKMVVWVWCFCGEFVVGCVAKVDEKLPSHEIRKMGQGF
jgi:hypothetical protein